MQGVLNDNALNFNAFLSNTTDYNTVLEFCREMSAAGLGRAIYTIDLAKSSEASEILRRDTLRELANNKRETGFLLFFFKTHSTGVNIAAAREVVDPEAKQHLQSEDGVLLVCGNYFLPEQSVRNEDGIVLIRALYNGNYRQV